MKISFYKILDNGRTMTFVLYKLVVLSGSFESCNRNQPIMRTLKHISIVIVFILNSCSKQEGTNGDDCTFDCTTFKGRIETVDHVGIPNVRVNLEHYSDNWLDVSIVDLGETYTDSEGYYKLNTFIEDKYLGYHYRQSFHLIISKSDIDDKIPSEYLKPDEMLYRNPTMTIYDIYKRDTLITNDFIIPKKSNLFVKLHNYEPIAENDYYRAIVSFEYDNLCPDWDYEPIVYDANAKSGINPTIFNFRTVLNDSTRVHIVKRKNGEIVVVKDTTLILKNPTYEMNFDY